MLLLARCGSFAPAVILALPATAASLGQGHIVFIKIVFETVEEVSIYQLFLHAGALNAFQQVALRLVIQHVIRGVRQRSRQRLHAANLLFHFSEGVFAVPCVIRLQPWDKDAQRWCNQVGFATHLQQLNDPDV